MNTSSTNTAPLAYFHDSGLEIVGNLTIEVGILGSITLNIRGDEVTFPVTVEEGFERFQLCKEGDEMTLYDGCSSVGASLPFSDFTFGDSDSLGLLRDFTSSQPIFQVILLLGYYCSLTHMYTFPLFRTVSHNSTSSVVLDQVLHRRAWPKCSVIPVQLTVVKHLFP